MIPGSVARDAHPEMAAALGVPLLDRWKPALVDQLLQLGEADSLKIDRRAALGHVARHWIASPRRLKAGVRLHGECNELQS